MDQICPYSHSHHCIGRKSTNVVKSFVWQNL